MTSTEKAALAGLSHDDLSIIGVKVAQAVVSELSVRLGSLCKDALLAAIRETTSSSQQQSVSIRQEYYSKSESDASEVPSSRPVVTSEMSGASVQSPRSSTTAGSAGSSFRPKGVTAMLQRLTKYPTGKAKGKDGSDIKTFRPAGQASTADVLPDYIPIRVACPTSEASSVVSCTSPVGDGRVRSIGALPEMTWKETAKAPRSSPSASSSSTSVPGTRGIGSGRTSVCSRRSGPASAASGKAGGTTASASARDAPMRPRPPATQGHQRRPAIARSPLAAAHAEAIQASIASRKAALGPVRFADDIIEESDSSSDKVDQLCLEDVTS